MNSAYQKSLLESTDFHSLDNDITPKPQKKISGYAFN